MEIRPNRSLPPLECGCGVSPSQGEEDQETVRGTVSPTNKSLAERKLSTSGVVAAIAPAVMAPRPGSEHRSAERGEPSGGRFEV